MRQLSESTVLRILIGRWKLGIVSVLMDESSMRFSALCKLLKDANHRVIAVQLRELERAGVLHRNVFSMKPPHVEYALTALGQSLKPVVDAIQVWDARHRMAGDTIQTT